MKRLITVFLVLILSITAVSCSNSPKPERSIQFYYCTEKIKHGSKSGVIVSETRYFTEAEMSSAIIAEYLSGPKSETLRSPFPAGLTVKDLKLGSARVEIILSDHIASQSGIDLTIACACIQKTIEDLTGIDSVQISAENEKINNQDVIIMESDSILLEDNEIVNPAYPDGVS